MTTVGELIGKLKEFDQEMIVAIADWFESFGDPSTDQAGKVYLREDSLIEDNKTSKFVCIGED